jgi:hypothetical protein
MELWGGPFRIYFRRKDMRAYFANLTPVARFLLCLPALALAYPLVTSALPNILRDLVPHAVRTVLSLIS